MRTSLFSLALSAAILSAGFASADEAIGKIRSLDDTGMTVTLSDGMVYSFNNMTDKHDVLSGFRPGDIVAINWNKVGDRNEARTISADYSARLVGTVKAVNEADKTVTLANGEAYKFGLGSSKKTDLGGYKVGDEVVIVADTEGGTHVGRSIAPVHSADVTGIVQSVDEATHTVTLMSGTVYKFDIGSSRKTDLGGYRVGDKVTIVSAMLGDTHWGRAIRFANS